MPIRTALPLLPEVPSLLPQQTSGLSVGLKVRPMRCSAPNPTYWTSVKHQVVEFQNLLNGYLVRGGSA